MLSGRVRYRIVGGGFELQSDDLALATRDKRALGPMDFSLRMLPAEGNRPGSGEFRADLVELAAVSSLLDYFPVDARLRRRVHDFAPSGRLHGLALAWHGSPGAWNKYRIKGRVEALALNAVDALPGVAGLSAEIAADETAGSLRLAAGQGAINLPRVFAEALPFDAVGGETRWKNDSTGAEVVLDGVTFSNADLALRVSGTYRTLAAGPGTIDLTGHVSRADGSQTPRYLPLALSPSVRDWLATSILAADVTEASLRLKGDLRDFPFRDARRGEFLVRVGLRNGVLEYDPAWPRIAGINGELLFHGARMEIHATKGAIFGAGLRNVVVAIADLESHAPLLTVNGEALGGFAEKIRFVNQSPVAAMIGGFTTGMRAAGNGALRLNLSIPLSHPEKTAVRGEYRFADASAELAGGVPPLSAINGVLLFTENGARADELTAVMLGGIDIDAHGRASSDALRTALGGALPAEVNGSADWHGALAIGHGGDTSLTVESPLLGVASTLPAPLVKDPAQPLALRVEARAAPGKPDQVRVRLGESVFAEFERRDAAPAAQIRGVIGFGKALPLTDQQGLWLVGSYRSASRLDAFVRANFSRPAGFAAQSGRNLARHAGWPRGRGRDRMESDPGRQGACPAEPPAGARRGVAGRRGSRNAGGGRRGIRRGRQPAGAGYCRG